MLIIWSSPLIIGCYIYIPYLLNNICKVHIICRPISIGYNIILCPLLLGCYIYMSYSCCPLSIYMQNIIWCPASFGTFCHAAHYLSHIIIGCNIIWGPIFYMLVLFIDRQHLHGIIICCTFFLHGSQCNVSFALIKTFSSNGFKRYRMWWIRQWSFSFKFWILRKAKHDVCSQNCTALFRIYPFFHRIALAVNNAFDWFGMSLKGLITNWPLKMQVRVRCSIRFTWI